MNLQSQTFMRMLLGGKIEISCGECEARQARLGLEWLTPPLVVASIAPVYTGVDYGKKDSLISEYESYVRGYLEREGVPAYCTTDIYNNVLAVLSLTSLEPFSMDEFFIRLHKKLYLHFNLDLFIGVGSPVGHLNAIGGSVSDARQMLAYKYQYADRGVVNIANIVKFQYNTGFGSEIALERVIGCFQDGDLGRMERRLHELVETVRNRPGVSKTSIRRVLIELTVRLLNVSSYSGVDVDEVLNGRDPYHWILGQNRTEIITDWIMRIASELLVRCGRQKNRAEKKAIQIACDYIEDNLQYMNLSLQSVSDKVGLSTAYFSQFFKNEIGIGVNAYIMNKRMARAKYLLENSDLKNNEIAMQLGYTTVNYFCRVFHKCVGMTPGQYRRTKRMD